MENQSVHRRATVEVSWGGGRTAGLILEAQWPHIGTHGPCFFGSNKRNLLVTSALGNRGAPRLLDMKCSAGRTKEKSMCLPTSFCHSTRGVVVRDRARRQTRAKKTSVTCMKCVCLPCHCVAHRWRLGVGRRYDRTRSYRVETLR